MNSNEREFDFGFSRRVFWVAVWLLAFGVISTGLLALANVLLPTVIHDGDLLTATQTIIQVMLKVSLVVLVISLVFGALLVGIYWRSRIRARQ